ncbi:prepilin peptidase CpaA [Butyrivibrio sp. YAB3001]|nr:prepilin peptidase CpaA [Butyrivibrio sp. YAB3001]
MSGAVLTDLCKDKIYNLWVVPGMLTGLIIALFQGRGRLLDALFTVAVSFLILIPVYLVKGIAAGDVKLLLSTASFLSLQEMYSCLLFSFLIAGAISLAVLVFSRKKKKTIHFAVPVLASTFLVLGGLV